MGTSRIEIPRMAGMYARERRRELGLTQRELAERSGVSERTIYSFELGEKPGIHLNKLLAIYAALGLTLEVGTTSPVDLRESVRPSPEDAIDDFLARLDGGDHGDH